LQDSIGTETKADIKSMTKAEMEDSFIASGLPKFRAHQVYDWLQAKGAESFDEMTNLNKALRQSLSDHYAIYGLTIEKKLVSSLDGTVKYLFRLDDGEYIESVVMSYHHGYTICISTQAGCRMGCRFCATGMGGLARNLRPSEMLSQVMLAQKDNGIRLSNIVLMGMGEPLDNFDNVMRFLTLVSDTEGVGIGMRHISLSTCGLVDKIEKLIEMKPQFTLSVSLHAPNDALRSEMMPINNRWNVERLLTACRRYAQVTRRRISFEYSLIKGKNDTDECARELAGKLKGMLCHVNLIPVNTVKGHSYERSSQAQIQRFINILEAKGITATVRRTLGADINASCGQLRRKKKEESDEDFQQD
jgi:23S rRNA m2A2503 methyltransferase